MTVSDAFLAGKLRDQYGRPPRSASFTVVTEGAFRGQPGFVRVKSDGRCNADGTFASGPLLPGAYYLRFFGLLLDSAGNSINEQSRVFDFIYPNAQSVSDAIPFDLHAGETLDLTLDVPEPTWHDISGRINCSFPVEGCLNLNILCQREMGILPDVGATGLSVKGNGGFSGMLLNGAYTLSLHEMSVPEPDGYCRSLRQFASTSLTIGRDLLDLELHFAG